MPFSMPGSWRCGPQIRMAALALLLLASWEIRGAALADPEVDRFNLRVGTQTFAGRYQFTTNSLLVETALAMREIGSDIVKFYLGRDFPRQYGIPLPPSVNRLTTLARDEPSARRVLDLPFRHVLVWAYCFSPGGDTHWADGLSATERQREHDEFYAFAAHLLTTYNDSGRRFYLGHWEGDWYLLPGYDTATNPSPTVVQGMRDWLNIRQQAVDNARRDIPHTNVHVYVYAEVNRVRDAMINGPDSNRRLVNQVLPAVPELDFVSWSAYDGQNLSRAELYRTLDFIEAHLSTNKSAVIPGRRVFIGEYGWGGTLASAEQEPPTRAFIHQALDWGAPFILFWQMYNNEPGRSYWLIDPDGRRTPCHHLHTRFLNQARLSTAEFRQEQGRLPGDAEFAALMAPFLQTAFPPPVSLTVSHGPVPDIGREGTQVRVTLVQGVYGEEQARVWLHHGRQDGGTDTAAWEHAEDLGLNTRFGPSTFTLGLRGIDPGMPYFYRARAANNRGGSWAPESVTLIATPPASGSGEGSVPVW